MRAPVVSLACKVATGLMLFAVMGGFPLLASALDGASSDKIALDDPARSAAANHSLDDQAKASALPAFVAADGRAHLSVDAPIGTAGGLQVFEASVEHAGLAFALVGDGGSVAAALVGVEIASERVVVPPSIEVGGASYPVVRIAPGAVEGNFISAIVVPATVSLIDDGAFDKAPYLESVQVDSGNESYSSCDGVLYDAAMERLLLIPEGKQGPVRIPKTAKVVPRIAHLLSPSRWKRAGQHSPRGMVAYTTMRARPCFAFRLALVTRSRSLLTAPMLPLGRSKDAIFSGAFRE